MNIGKLKNHDWLITLISFVLLFMGTIIIYSATINSTNAIQGEGTLPKQLIFIIVGLVIYFGISMIDFSWLRSPSILAIAYLGIILCLIYVKFFTSSIANTNRWIDLGFFSFQPSEYAKVVLILVSAGIFTVYERVIDSKPYLIINRSTQRKSKSGIKALTMEFMDKFHESYPILFKYTISSLLAFPIVFLIFIQPALGSSIIIFLIWLIIQLISFPDQKNLLGYLFITLIFFFLIKNFVTFYSNDEGNYLLSFQIDLSNTFYTFALLLTAIITTYFARLKLLIPLLAIVSSVVIIFGFYFSWNNLLTPYQQTRITTYIEGPESDPTNAGYQVRQSKIAIGSGRLTGRGFLQGSQSGSNVLTQAHTDFVFAALSEQFGFIGSTLVIVLYIILILRVIKIGLNSASDFGTIVCAGVATLILLHVFINIGMNLGKLPVTGIPLPLISYGGSSVFVILISLGLVQAIGGSQKSVDIADNLMLRSRSLSN